MNIKVKKNTNLSLLFGIFFFLTSFFLFYSSKPRNIEAACSCTSHWCCGTVGCDGCCGCVWDSFSGSVSCNCNGSTMYCCRGNCCDCNPPSCPTGYTTTNTGCATTTTSCTRKYCNGSSCGTSTRTCWKVLNTVAYDDNGGSCPADLSVCYGSASAAPNCTRSYYTATSYSITAGSCASGWNATTGYCGSVTTGMTIRPNWTINSYTVTYDGNGADSCTRSSESVNHGSASLGNSCSRDLYDLTGFTVTSGSCGGTFDSITAVCSSVTQTMSIQANWKLACVPPTAPTELLIDNASSPAVVADTTPYFSAIFNDPDATAYSEQYQIQVNTASDFSGTSMWDSGITSMTRTDEGERTSNLNYGGSALSLDGSTYYWRIRMTDECGYTSPYSSTATFTMNRAPSTPTDLETEEATNPTCVSDATPEFTAVYSDPDGHAASQYQIQVNTASDFNGTSMWDSGLTGSISTASGNRTDPISYAGTTLTFNGTTYYWRIRFADAYGTVSPWSATANFKMNTPPTTPTQPLTESLVNPIDIGILDPTFSAIFNDPDTCSTIEYSENYEIEVNTNSSFTGSVMWDTGQTSMATTNKGSRSPEITYDGTALSLNGATYYWRIRFWDSVGSISPWSTTSSFTMEANQTPTAPTGLLVNGISNNPRVNGTEPAFSAIYNDPNQYDFSNYYEIEVNTNETFTGTIMWDSGQQFMSTTTQGARSPNITYNGSTLNLEGVTYYWRIRFWDAANAVSPWATGTFTTAGSYATFQNLQFGGLIFDMP